MHYEAALRINPRFSQTLNNMGVIYTMIGRMDEGLHYCQLAIKYNPQYAEAHNNLGVLYRDEGRIDEAIQNYEKCCELNPSSKNASQNRLLALNYSPKFSTEFVSEQHRIWGIKFSKTFERLPKINARNARGVNERLRIGYVSPDFCTHSVSYFIEAPLLHADKTKFEVYCYSNLSKGDSRTEYFKTLCKNWREISHLSTLDACKIIMEDEIDILIDLTGHTAGNRLDIFAMKPAPIQATWIGYPNSTGLETVDVRITDGIVDAHDTKQTFVENLFRLPGPFLCYSHPHSMPPVSAPPCSNYGFVTFGSFNNLAKITSEVIALWSRVVLAVPRSRMLLKSKAFATKNVRDRIMKYFAENGVSEDRIDLFPLLSKTGDHLSLYSSIDIALDTFPYAGTTTTCESLIMGVPVITLTGQIHAQNVGKTLLTRIESLKFCIAATPEDYVKKAVSLANDPIRLKEIRHKMREACISSDLCNGKQFTQRLEAAFLSMQFKALDM
jgi:predicted O-linked N-acetylglucosamine transferase (SPINDLY family)